MAEDKLATRPTEAMEAYDDLIADAGKGKELITEADVRPPRLMLCQSGTPQRKPDNPKLIPNLNELDLFNSLTNEIYGRTLRIIVIKSLGTHWTEFDSNLKVVDLNVPEGDPRTLWRDGPSGERIKPIAVHFYDYLIFVPDTQEVLSFSMKSTQISKAIAMNSVMQSPLRVEGTIVADPPAWARMFKLETKSQSGKGFNWGGFLITTLGITPRELRLEISKLSKIYEGKDIQIDREDEVPEGEGDGTDFDPAELEKE